MKPKVCRKFFFWVGFFSLMLALLVTNPALAQCGDTPEESSCITCHEREAADPVMQNGEWHNIHAAKDCCWNCHGGNTTAQEEELAHMGMTTQPLSDIYTDCRSCHPDDYQQRAGRFALALGITPAGSATATPLGADTRISHTMVVEQAAPLRAEMDTTPLIIALVTVSGALILLAVYCSTRARPTPSA